jgi:hypothetical protein
MARLLPEWLWDRLATWCLRSSDLDGVGRRFWGSAVEWRWLTLGDAVEGGTRAVGTSEAGRTIERSWWRRIPRGAPVPGTDWPTP